MTEILYRTHFRPTWGDPLGGNPHGEPGSSLVPARLVEQLADGRLRLTVQSEFGCAEVIAEEGSEPGQVRTRSGLKRKHLRELRRRVEQLERDEHPEVRIAAAAFLGITAGRRVAQVADDLVQVAETHAHAGGLRALAVVLLAVLVSEERDR